jgi:hypothetical protein
LKGVADTSKVSTTSVASDSQDTPEKPQPPTKDKGGRPAKRVGVDGRKYKATKPKKDPKPKKDTLIGRTFNLKKPITEVKVIEVERHGSILVIAKNGLEGWIGKSDLVMEEMVE